MVAGSLVWAINPPQHAPARKIARNHAQKSINLGQGCFSPIHRAEETARAIVKPSKAGLHTVRLAPSPPGAGWQPNRQTPPRFVINATHITGTGHPAIPYHTESPSALQARMPPAFPVLCQTGQWNVRRRSSLGWTASKPAPRNPKTALHLPSASTLPRSCHIAKQFDQVGGNKQTAGPTELRNKGTTCRGRQTWPAAGISRPAQLPLSA